jgi:hypothetical protein
MLVAAPVALLPVCPAAAQDGAPVVSPDRIEDLPSIKADADAFPDLDNFAWRAFIALNWPSLTDPAHCGVPHLAKALGDPGPVSGRPQHFAPPRNSSDLSYPKVADPEDPPLHPERHVPNDGNRAQKADRSYRELPYLSLGSRQSFLSAH